MDGSKGTFSSHSSALTVCAGLHLKWIFSVYYPSSLLCPMPRILCYHKWGLIQIGHTKMAFYLLLESTEYCFEATAEYQILDKCWGDWENGEFCKTLQIMGKNIFRNRKSKKNLPVFFHQKFKNSLLILLFLLAWYVTRIPSRAYLSQGQSQVIHWLNWFMCFFLIAMIRVANVIHWIALLFISSVKALVWDLQESLRFNHGCFFFSGWLSKWLIDL